MSEQVPVNASPAKGTVSRRVRLVVPIVLMVLSAAGIGTTVGVGLHGGASSTPAPGYYQGGGQRPAGRGSGVPAANPSDRPSGYPTAGRPSDRPSGADPSALPSGGFAGRGGTGRPGAGAPSNRPGGGFQGVERPAGTFPGAANRPAARPALSGLDIGLIVGCGVIFLGSLAFLVVELVRRQKSKTAGQPAQPVGPAPDQSGQWTAPAGSNPDTPTDNPSSPDGPDDQSPAAPDPGRV